LESAISVANAPDRASRMSFFAAALGSKSTVSFIGCALTPVRPVHTLTR
jgi:hypothetical protein